LDPTRRTSVPPQGEEEIVPAPFTRRKLLSAAGIGAAGLVVSRLTGCSESAGDRGVGSGGRGDTAGRQAAAGAQVSVDADGVAPTPAGPDSPPALDGAPSIPGPDHRFDVVIQGGRVVDPASGFDGLINVGIDGATVTALSAAPLDGRQVIDATGKVVAPGFIDLLSYEPNEFGARLKLADGVTTNLAMHGVSNFAPIFFDRYTERSPVHFGGAFHHHFIRGFEMGVGVGQRLDTAQMRSLERLLREGLEDGFAGVCFSPEYSPGTSNEEIARLVAVAAEYGHVSFFHLRHSDPDPPGTSLESLAEVMSIAERTGASIHIQHLSSTGGTFVMEEAIAMIEDARDYGIDVTACVYPYDFWGTYLASERFSDGWQERYRIDYEDLQVAGTEERLTEQTFRRAVLDNKLVAALGSIPEDEVRLALSQPWVMVASDAILTRGLNNHPRGSGTFARTLGRYVRDVGLLDLRTGLAKITIQPALRVESMIPDMKRKGRLQRGADADIVVFDPATITDQATVAEPALPSLGIQWVLVDGRIAVRSGRVQTQILAGRALRGVVP
jgi:N-acyl-D-aspartate/D-glutamate deacylase